MSDPPQIKYLFIRRPIFAGVISIVIVLLGAFALYTLPINRYPLITPPSVQVSAVYPGATAEDVANAVAAPIEQQLSGLDGLLYFKSSNASDGTMSLQVYFDLSRDLDLAAVDVQNQVSVAQPQLPQEVVRQGITITKAQTDILAVIALSSKDPRYDATYLNNYARIYVIDDGSVAQCGTYAELMAQPDGRFARLFASHHESADGLSRHSMQGIGHSPQSSM